MLFLLKHLPAGGIEEELGFRVGRLCLAVGSEIWAHDHTVSNPPA